MTGESHIEAAIAAAGGSGSGESHIKSCLEGGGGSLAGESHIMACLAAAGALLPPDLGNLLYWFDVNDISTLFKDQAGTMPVTTDLDVFNRIDNKGSDTANVPFLHDRMIGGNAPPIYFATELGGKAAMGVKTGGLAWNMQVQVPGPSTPVGPAAGITIAAVGRVNSTSFAANTRCGWGGNQFVDNDSDANITAGNWAGRLTSTVDIDSGVASPVNIWNYEYLAQAGTDIRLRVGGSAEQTIVHASYTAVNANQVISMNGFRSQWAEFLIWSGQLSLPDRILLSLYFDTKFPVLPF